VLGLGLGLDTILGGKDKLQNPDAVISLGTVDALDQMASYSLAGLRKGFARAIRYVMEQGAEDQYITALDVADFPASFSVLLNNDLGRAQSNTPDRYLRKPAELEQHMVEVIERHANRVARWGLGSRAQVKSDILAGVWCIWQVVL